MLMVKGNYLKHWMKTGVIVGVCLIGMNASTVMCNAFTDEVQMNEIDEVYGLEFDMTLDEFKENYNNVRKGYFWDTVFESAWEEELEDEHIISLEDEVTSLPAYYCEPDTYELTAGYGGEVTDYIYVSRLLGGLIAQMTVIVDSNNNIIGICYVCLNEKREIMEIDWTNFILILQGLNLDSGAIMDKLVENVEETGEIIYYQDGVAIRMEYSNAKYLNSRHPVLRIIATNKEFFEEYFAPDSIYE